VWLAIVYISIGWIIGALVAVIGWKMARGAIQG